MSLIIDNDGTISLYQGDSGEVVVSGLDSSKSCTVYFAIQDEKRRPIGNEVFVQSNNQPTVVFELSSSLTDLLKVGQNDETATYYYGVKSCSPDGFEDTLPIGGSDMGDKNTITVYPKKVEGC
jgi:hypothetical protein